MSTKTQAREAQMVSEQARTPEDVAELKRQWLADPCWDIEDTEGFEAHRAELKAFHDEQSATWAERAAKRDAAELKDICQRYGVSSDVAPAIRALLADIAALSERVAALEARS